jgi:hypothetical protein
MADLSSRLHHQGSGGAPLGPSPNRLPAGPEPLDRAPRPLGNDLLRW